MNFKKVFKLNFFEREKQICENRVSSEFAFVAL